MGTGPDRPRPPVGPATPDEQGWRPPPHRVGLPPRPPSENAVVTRRGPGPRARGGACRRPSRPRRRPGAERRVHQPGTARDPRATTGRRSGSPHAPPPGSGAAVEPRPVGAKSLAVLRSLFWPEPGRLRMPERPVRASVCPRAQDRPPQPKWPQRQSSSPSPPRAQARQQKRRPGSGRHRQGGWPHQPASASGAASMPPGPAGSPPPDPVPAPYAAGPCAADADGIRRCRPPGAAPPPRRRSPGAWSAPPRYARRDGGAGQPAPPACRGAGWAARPSAAAPPPGGPQ